MKIGITLATNKFITSIIAREERRTADNSFLYKELTISVICFIISVIAIAKYLVILDNNLYSPKIGFFLIELLSSFTWLSCVDWFSLTILGVVSGAKIAGATRIRAATRSGASKYVLTATIEPAECLPNHFGDISASKKRATVYSAEAY